MNASNVTQVFTNIANLILRKINSGIIDPAIEVPPAHPGIRSEESRRFAGAEQPHKPAKHLLLPGRLGLRLLLALQ